MTDIRERLMQANNPNLPNVSPGASQLLSAVMSDEIPLNELGLLIEQYPVVAARLIAVANSAWSAPEVEIVAIQPACARLGIDVVRTIAIALTISSPFDPTQSTNFDIARFWCSGLFMAESASILSPYFQVSPQLARAAGLIRNLGLLWLTDEAPSHVDKALDAVQSEAEAGLNEVLISQCGIGYLEASAYLFRAWNLPDVFVTAVDPVNDPLDPFTRLLQIAAAFAWALGEGLNANSLDLVGSPEITREVIYEIYNGQSEHAERTKELACSLFH
ncbi:MAG: HDOD domain-containing protein [Pseudomonadales bacterium]